MLEATSFDTCSCSGTASASGVASGAVSGSASSAASSGSDSGSDSSSLLSEVMRASSASIVLSSTAFKGASGSLTTVLVTCATEGWYLRVVPDDTFDIFGLLIFA